MESEKSKEQQIRLEQPIRLVGCGVRFRKLKKDQSFNLFCPHCCGELTITIHAPKGFMGPHIEVGYVPNK